MSPLVEQYRQWMRSWGAAEKTIRARTLLAQARLDEWGGVTGFTADNIQAFLGRAGLSKWTRATYHANLNSFCEYLVTAGHLVDSPMGGVRKPRRPHSQPRPLTESEVDRVLASATGRTRDWIQLALCEGLRAHEIAKIRGEDVSMEGLFVNGKGDVDATLPTHPDIWEMAQRYPRVGYWFPSPYGEKTHITSASVTSTVGRLFRDLGIEGSVHRCRHTYGTRLLRTGTNIRKVQKLMRHATLETTATYTAVDEDELREAILKLPHSA